MRVTDVMVREVVTVEPETPLKEVARVLVEHGISGVPVVDDGRVLGVVSESDFIMKERAHEPRRRSPLTWLIGDRLHAVAVVEARTAGQAMTAPAVTIEPAATVHEAAVRMAGRNVNRLPVVESGTLVGIITRGDLVRLYAEPDTLIEQRVRRALRVVDGLKVEQVQDGVVTLAGVVASEALARTIVDIAAGIEGVVAVDSEGLVGIGEGGLATVGRSS
jgi:CBS domain-containing protein